MEKENLTFLMQTEEALTLSAKDIKSYSGLALAFIGDGVYELAIRTLILSQGNCAVNKMHHKCSELVKAPTQAAMLSNIMDELSEEEQAIVRRGRNSSPHSKAKNASVEDYLSATAWEALCGWLYLSDNQPRLMEVIAMGLKSIGAIS